MEKYQRLFPTVAFQLLETAVSHSPCITPALRPLYLFSSFVVKKKEK